MTMNLWIFIVVGIVLLVYYDILIVNGLVVVRFSSPTRSQHQRYPVSLKNIENPNLEVDNVGDIDHNTIQLLVEERSKARWDGDYDLADTLKEKIHTCSPDGYEIILEDKPRKTGGGTAWKIQPIQRCLVEEQAYYEQQYPGPTVLQLAHAALGAAVEISTHRSYVRARTLVTTQQEDILLNNQLQEEIANNKAKEKSRLDLMVQAKDRLDRLLNDDSRIVQTIELGGRKAADAAFWFALAACSDQELLFRLADIASMELERSCDRSSCRPKDVYHILERFAAAGLQRHDRLQNVADACLFKKLKDTNNQHQPGDCSLDFHSDRSLLLIWKFSTKQKKQYAFLNTAKKHWERHYHQALQRNNTEVSESHSVTSEGSSAIEDNSYDWNKMFDDPTRPLVVDIGCGMGVSLLGLASSESENAVGLASSRLLLGNLTWSDCNFVGVDLGKLGISFAGGVTQRWNLQGRLQFVADSAEDFCLKLPSYPGNIVLYMCQFPTPYRLQTQTQTDKSGNLQLPTSQVDGFMVTKKLMELIHSSLHSTTGRLLIQSNCEDVAVYMRNLACHEVGFSYVQEDTESSPLPMVKTEQPLRIPQRTQDWVEMGGERASGPGWFDRPILHQQGCTETEVACRLNGTPIHRCILVQSNN